MPVVPAEEVIVAAVKDLDAIIRNVEKEQMTERNPFGPGDTVVVSVKIQEGGKTRVQDYTGVVIQRNGSGLGQTVTVRKVSSDSVYVERIFPIHSPLIEAIKVTRRGKVRRAKLYYLRGLTGKATRIKEKK